MTVSSDLNRITYAGNGTTTVFAVNYYFLEDAHLQVVLISATGVETVQTLTTNYTVSGAGNEAGGSITMLVAPPTGTTLVIQRNVPATQETDYLANDPFPAESHERALDKLTMLVQQNERDIDRALKIPLSAVGSTSTDLPIPVGNKLLAWNSDASAVTNFDPSDVITIVGQQTSYGDVFTGNGSTTNFSLTRSPGSVFGLDVSINGVTQVPNVDYILSGTTLSFTTAPPAAASKILARYAEVYEEVSADAQNVRYLPAGTGAELTTVQAKLRETVSVKDFGAVGDGVTDDTAAIQAAIAASANKEIFFPSGDYLISATIYTGRNVSMRGEGSRSSRILLSHSGIGIQTSVAVAPYGDYTRNQNYEGIGIVANVNTTYGLWAVNTLYCRFTDVQVTVPQAAGSGFTAFRVAGSVYLTTFENCVSDTIEESGTTKHGGKGWWIGNGENEFGSAFASTNENTFITCRGQRAEIGWDLDICRGCVFITCGGETCNTAGFNVRGDENILIAPWIEDADLVFNQYTQGNGSGGSLAPANPNFNQVIGARTLETVSLNYGQMNTFTGCRINNITIGANATQTNMADCFVLTSITNNGSDGNLKYRFGGVQYHQVQYGTNDAYLATYENAKTTLELWANQGIESNNAGNLKLLSDAAVEIAGAKSILKLNETVSLGSAPTDSCYLYVKDNGAGKTQLVAIFQSGVEQVIATEP